MKNISERIKGLLKERGLKAKPFAVKAGIEPTQFSRMLRGIRQWTIPHLQKVANALGVQVGDLTDEVRSVPIIASINAFQGCPFPEKIESATALGFVPLPRFGLEKGVKEPLLSKLYAIQIEDDSFMPAIEKGMKLIIQKDTHEGLQEGNMVVYCDATGKANIGRLSFYDDHLLLKSLNPKVKDLILPKAHLKLMDLVIAQIYS
jgi:SOS-response transcriptional repressor LexA